MIFSLTEKKGSVVNSIYPVGIYAFHSKITKFIKTTVFKVFPSLYGTFAAMPISNGNYMKNSYFKIKTKTLTEIDYDMLLLIII